MIEKAIKLTKCDLSEKNLSLESVGIYSQVVRRGAPYKCYNGNPGLVVDIYRSATTSWIVRKFPFTSDNADEAWTKNYYAYGEKQLEQLKVGEHKLYSLQYNCFITDVLFDFRFVPPRGDDTLFIVDESARDDYKGYYLFERRDEYKIEDSCVFEAMHYMSKFSLPMPLPSAQRSIGKRLLAYLYESYYNQKPVKYLEMSKLAIIFNMIDFHGGDTYYAEKVMKNMGPNTNRVKDKIFGTALDDESQDEFKSFDKIDINKYLNDGKISLKELLAIGADALVNALSSTGAVIKIEIDDMFDVIREACIQGDEILIVPFSTQKDVDFVSIFNTENVSLRDDSLFLTKG